MEDTYHPYMFEMTSCDECYGELLPDNHGMTHEEGWRDQYNNAPKVPCIVYMEDFGYMTNLCEKHFKEVYEGFIRFIKERKC